MACDHCACAHYQVSEHLHLSQRPKDSISLVCCSASELDTTRYNCCHVVPVPINVVKFLYTATFHFGHKIQASVYCYLSLWPKDSKTCSLVKDNTKSFINSEGHSSNLIRYALCMLLLALSCCSIHAAESIYPKASAQQKLCSSLCPSIHTTPFMLNLCSSSKQLSCCSIYATALMQQQWCSHLQSRSSIYRATFTQP